MSTLDKQKDLEAQAALLKQTLSRIEENWKRGMTQGVIQDGLLKEPGEKHQWEFRVEQKDQNFSIIVTDRFSVAEQQVIVFTKNGDQMDLKYIPTAPAIERDVQKLTRGEGYRSNNNILSQLGWVANMIGEVANKAGKQSEIAGAIQ